VTLIAIDGPAGAGKSTVARALAQRLGLARLDTGAMYRAVTLAALRAGIAVDDEAALEALAASSDLALGEGVELDGEDVTAAIRGPEVDAAVSAVAATPAVRTVLVERQRAWIRAHGGGVVEGRDITSVVAPEADVRVYLTAHEGERARRRATERPDDAAAVAADLARRDAHDSGRADSPLQVVEGVRVLDTTGRSVEAVVEEVCSWL
jgi:CMP/dCMP kinase